MDSTDSDIANLINVPKEVLFQDYLLPPWIWTHLYINLSIILSTAGHL